MPRLSSLPRPLAAAAAGALLLAFTAPGAWGEEFRRWAESARGLGVGGALTAVASGSDAMLYNPAGLAQDVIWKAELAYSLDESEDDPRGVFDRLDDMPGTPAEVGELLIEGQESRYSREQLFASFHTGGGFGLAAIDVRTRQSQPTAAGLDYREERFTGAMATLAWSTGLRLIMFGVTVKVLGRQLIEEEFTAAELSDPAFDLEGFRSSGNDFAYDAGVLIRLPIPFIRPTIGAAQINGGDPDFGFSKRPALLSETNVGVSLNPYIFTDAAQLLLMYEQRDINDHAYAADDSSAKREHYGAELSFFPKAHGIWALQLRAGDSQGKGTWGVGVNFDPFLSIDVAQYSELLGTEDRPQWEKRTILQIKLGF